jgi:hypothetical protein
MITELVEAGYSQSDIARDMEGVLRQVVKKVLARS